MGIRKYNDMKEHNISRIQWIRHPSPANTHQSLCAHNLITKHITAAKQPRYSDASLLMQAKIPQLFLLLKTCQLEDCGGVRRVVGTFYFYYYHHYCILAGFPHPNSNTLHSFFSRPSFFLPTSLFLPLYVLQSIAHRPQKGKIWWEQGKLTFHSVRIMSVIWSIPHRDYVSTSKEWLYAAWILPACRGAIQALRNKKSPTLMALGWLPTPSGGSVRSNNLASANSTCGEMTAGRTARVHWLYVRVGC